MAALVTSQNVGELKSFSCKQLEQRVRIKLEGGEIVALRRNYAAHLHAKLHNVDDKEDPCWLSLDGEHGVCFNTKNGTCLYLYIVPQEHMHILLDQSGSMQTIQDAVYKGAQELVEELSEGAIVIFSTFASEVKIGHAESKARALEQLSSVPTAHGLTRLYDAIVQATTGQASNTTLLIVTDGLDTNSVSTSSHASVAAQRFQSDPSNRILFLGSNQDAVLAAQALHIPAERALTFGAEATHMRAALRSASDNVTRYRSLGTDEFTIVERHASLEQPPEHRPERPPYVAGERL